jgi:hypothetical protein
MGTELTSDRRGRSYARYSQLKKGDKVEVDRGFTCMKASIKVVRESKHGLYVTCDEGTHYLAGQLTQEDYLIGVYHYDRR